MAPPVGGRGLGGRDRLASNHLDSGHSPHLWSEFLVTNQSYHCFQTCPSAPSIHTTVTSLHLRQPLLRTSHGFHSVSIPGLDAADSTKREKGGAVLEDGHSVYLPSGASRDQGGGENKHREVKQDKQWNCPINLYKHTLMLDAECVPPCEPLAQDPKTPTPRPRDQAPSAVFMPPTFPRDLLADSTLQEQKENQTSHSLAWALVHSPPPNPIISFARS